MDPRFQNFTAKVLLIEPSGNVRGMISDVIKSLGFTSVQAMDSIRSALGYMEVESVDWIVMPIQPDESVNAFQLLQIVNSHEKFKDTVATLLIDDKEANHLPQAFHYGLCSWHLKTNLSKDGLVREFRDFLDIMKQHNGFKTLVAFEYLQLYLRSAGKADLLIESCEDLVKAFPTNPYAILNLAGNQFALERRAEALHTLGHAKACDIPGWEKFAKEHLNDGEEVSLKLPCKRILVVDPDESIHNHLKDTLLKYCEKAEIKFSIDGESACNWLEANPSVDLVLQEWRIPKITGHVFLQRIRKITGRMIPVIVISSLLKKEDVPILNEMSVSTGIEKPIEERAFIKATFNALQQHASPTAPKWIERKIQERLNLEDYRAVERLYKRLVEHPQCTEDLKFYVQALRFYTAKDYQSAKILAIKSIQLGGDQVKTFTLLGRCLASLREFDGAVKCFSRAQSMSPKNIERLCELAEAQVEAGQEEAARESIDQAKEMDETNSLVVSTEVKVAIKTGATEKARELMYHMGSIEQLISDMNGSAVALVRTGKFEKGVELYNRTLDSIPTEDKVTKTRVLYNLALAFARQDDLPSAKLTIDKADVDIDLPVKEKVLSLRVKLEKALSNQSGVKLQTGNTVPSQNTNPWETEVTPDKELMDRDPTNRNQQSGPLKISQFDHGIMGTVRLPESARAPSEALVKAPPIFTLRSAIEREESMGAEKLAQSAS
jgi:CheY-like chemotaxis protein